jgi:hypothetical protein
MMQNPFVQHMNDIFESLRGRNMVIISVIWIILLILGLLCTFGAIKLPGSVTKTEIPTIVSTPGSATQPVNATATQQSEGETPQATTPGTITLPTPTPTAESGGETVPALPWGEFGYGIAAHGISMPYYTMDQIKGQLGMNWVKQQVRWDHFSSGPDQMDWSGYDAMVDAASERGLKVLMSVVGAPNWSRTYFDANPQAAPPDDYSVYARFLGELVDRYKGKIHAIEVWNEQNLDREWDTAEGVIAKKYVELLRLAYQAIKSRDASIIVISGALSPTGATWVDDANPNRYIVIDDFVYFQQMIDTGFLSYADCVGVHHNGYNMPPDVEFDEGYNDPTAIFRGPFDSPHHSWSFKSTLFGYHDMILAAGRNTPLCITEFGWASSEGLGGTPQGFEFASDNTQAEQAAWDVQSFQLMREWGFVYLAFLWNLDYSYKGGLGITDPNTPYSILDLEGAARPAYGALGEMAKIP